MMINPAVLLTVHNTLWDSLPGSYNVYTMWDTNINVWLSMCEMFVTHPYEQYSGNDGSHRGGLVSRTISGGPLPYD
jgi:hypothetical protein